MGTGRVAEMIDPHICKGAANKQLAPPRLGGKHAPPLCATRRYLIQRHYVSNVANIYQKTCFSFHFMQTQEPDRHKKLHQALGAVCFWQPTLWAKPGCCLSCVTVYVSLLPCVADCYMSYIVCKVERFVLTN